MPYQEHIHQSAGDVGRCTVITLSDTRTAETDTSGRRIQELLGGAGHLVVRYEIIPDDPIRLEAVLAAFLADDEANVMLTNGGTGISRRDHTVPVIEKMIASPLPGFGELFRMLSFQQIGSGAMLSRALAGVAGGKLIFAMPGSTAAVELAMERLILPELKHLLHELRR